MKSLFGKKEDPDLMAREAVRRKKWTKAIELYEKQLDGHERDFALWNLLGDLHLNNHSRAQAVEAWRRALEGYSSEGLHENALGIARKILHRAPEEEDVYLLLAGTYLDLEYHADCLEALRNYLKLSQHHSEPALRSLFRKTLESPLHHPHLLDELTRIYSESRIEDIELEQQLQNFVGIQLEADRQMRRSPVIAEDVQPEGAALETAPDEKRKSPSMATLGDMKALGDSSPDSMPDFLQASRFAQGPEDRVAESFDPSSAIEFAEPLAGGGKDHYDLGTVYKEMKLWDAAIAEYEQARRDPAIHIRATLDLVECLEETQDLQAALQILEKERENAASDNSERLNVSYHLGIVHELLGNLEDAFKYFEAVKEQNGDFADVQERCAELRGKL